ncbi:MAG: hypothetical protein WDN08_10640 [Rhizomicrobium sp.]
MAQIVEAVDLVGVVVGQQHGVGAHDAGIDQLILHVGRGVDQDDGLAGGRSSPQDDGAAAAAVLRIRRVGRRTQ